MESPGLRLVMYTCDQSSGMVNVAMSDAGLLPSLVMETALKVYVVPIFT